MKVDRTRVFVHAVLLVPEEGDPMGLLLGSGCGSRPPTAFSGHLCGHAHHRAWKPIGELVERSCYMCGDPKKALVLAWEGEALPVGCFRARLDFWKPVYDRVRRMLTTPAAGAVQARMAMDLELRGLGRLVLVDSDGAEVDLGKD